MKNRKRTITELAPKYKKEIWADGIFVWDTSALCRLYALTPVVRDQMIDILETVADRIWIPAHVMTEFDRHCREELKKPLSKYDMPKDLGKAMSVSAVGAYLKELTDNHHLHPLIEDEALKKATDNYQEVTKAIEKLRVCLQDALKQGKDNYEAEIKDDKLGNFVRSLDSGPKIKYSRLLEIAREGVWRFEAQIPPGYRDKEEKDSIDQYGDLIIWKEIIEHAAKEQKPVVLIIQDLKEDWNALKEESEGAKSCIVPREELLMEFEEQTGQKIWMYTIADFMKELKGTVGNVEEGSPFENLDKLNEELELAAIPDDCIKVKCDNCGHISGVDTDDVYWEWDTDVYDSREMGVELCSIIEHYHECPFCDKEIDMTFEAYQYPIPVINDIELQVDGGDVMASPDLESYCDTSELMKFESCVVCGEWRNDVNKDGWCEDCLKEFERKVNED